MSAAFGPLHLDVRPSSGLGRSSSLRRSPRGTMEFSRVESGYQPLVVVLLAFCAGVVMDRELGARGFLVSMSWSWIASAVGLGIWYLLWIFRADRWAVWPLLGSVAVLACAWHHDQWHMFSPRDLGHFARDDARPVCVEGTALWAPRLVPAPPADPMRSMQVGDRSRLEVSIDAIRSGTEWWPARGLSTVYVSGHLAGIRAANRVRIFGRLGKPASSRNPGEFDFALHSRADRRLSVLRADFPECVQLLERNRGGHLRGVVDGVRGMADRFLWRHVAAERAGLAAGLLLGSREQLGTQRIESYVTTGTVHLLVVSGLHLGILASGLFFALRLGLLPRRSALALVAALVVAYTVLTGAQAPIVRSAVLVVVLCVGRVFGRQTLAFNALAASALIVLLLNPADLFRTGPQLSFLAVAALGWIGGRQRDREPPDPLVQLIAAARPWPVRSLRWCGRWTWEATVASAVVWLVLAPLLMARFHLFSPVAVFLSPLLCVPVAVSLFSGFGVLVCGWFCPPLGVCFAWLCDHSLQLVDACVISASAIPGNHFWVTGPHTWWLVVCYALLALFVLWPRYCPPRRWCVALLSGWVGAGLMLSSFSRNRGEELGCTFLAVGHGCAVVLELPGGETVLYDTGSLTSPEASARAIASYLWSRGIMRLDAVILSHADVDHYNALPELLERFPVRTVVVSTVMFEDPDPGPRRLRSVLEAAGVPITVVAAGDCLKPGRDFVLRVLYPPSGGVGGSDNANSVVLAVEYAGRRFLFPGDLEPPGLYELMRGPPLKCDVLLAPHHGSRHSDPQHVARWCMPDWVVISRGFQAGHDDVPRVYQTAGAQVLATGKVGAVRFVVREGELSLVTSCGSGLEALCSRVTP